MFDQMKAMGAIAGLLKNKDRLREIGEQFREKIDRLNVTGSAGGGAVRVTVNGRMRVTDVHLDPAMIAGLGAGEGGRVMAQSLIQDAMNDAMEQVQRLVREEADRMAKELGLPEMPGLDRLLG